MLLSDVLPSVQACLRAKRTEIVHCGLQAKRLFPFEQPFSFSPARLFVLEEVAS